MNDTTEQQVVVNKTEGLLYLPSHYIHTELAVLGPASQTARDGWWPMVALLG